MAIDHSNHLFLVATLVFCFTSAVSRTTELPDYATTLQSEESNATSGGGSETPWLHSTTGVGSREKAPEEAAKRGDSGGTPLEERKEKMQEISREEGEKWGVYKNNGSTKATYLEGVKATTKSGAVTEDPSTVPPSGKHIEATEDAENLNTDDEFSESNPNEDYYDKFEVSSDESASYETEKLSEGNEICIKLGSGSKDLNSMEFKLLKQILKSKDFKIYNQRITNTTDKEDPTNLQIDHPIGELTRPGADRWGMSVKDQPREPPEKVSGREGGGAPRKKSVQDRWSTSVKNPPPGFLEEASSSSIRHGSRKDEEPLHAGEKERLEKHEERGSRGDENRWGPIEATSPPEEVLEGLSKHSRRSRLHGNDGPGDKDWSMKHEEKILRRYNEMERPVDMTDPPAEFLEELSKHMKQSIRHRNHNPGSMPKSVENKSTKKNLPDHSSRHESHRGNANSRSLVPAERMRETGTQKEVHEVMVKKHVHDLTRLFRNGRWGMSVSTPPPEFLNDVSKRTMNSEAKEQVAGKKQNRRTLELNTSILSLPKELRADTSRKRDRRIQRPIDEVESMLLKIDESPDRSNRQRALDSPWIRKDDRSVWKHRPGKVIQGGFRNMGLRWEQCEGAQSTYELLLQSIDFLSRILRSRPDWRTDKVDAPIICRLLKVHPAVAYA
ncbi:hypothetical protein KM043_013125 [Ampulex compressa]|nr:hypothetical protein KM043_013125 [Ampulex compressa]